MLKKLFPQQPPPSTTDKVAEIIPDPWEVISSEDAVKPRTEVWKPSIEAHPLIAAEKKPEILSLPPPTTRRLFSPVQMLLQDGLKIKAYNGGMLKEHLQKAVGLLSWIETFTPEYAG